MIWKYKSGDSDKKEDNESRRQPEQFVSELFPVRLFPVKFPVRLFSIKISAQMTIIKKRNEIIRIQIPEKKGDSQAQIKRIDERLEKFVNYTQRSTDNIWKEVGVADGQAITGNFTTSYRPWEYD